MVTFTINIPQMLAYIAYMDPMGYGCSFDSILNDYNSAAFVPRSIHSSSVCSWPVPSARAGAWIRFITMSSLNMRWMGLLKCPLSNSPLFLRDVPPCFFSRINFDQNQLKVIIERARPQPHLLRDWRGRSFRLFHHPAIRSKLWTVWTKTAWEICCIVGSWRSRT